MKALVEAFPKHLEEAMVIGRAAQLTKTEKTFDNIVISGLGGSGIGGKIVSQWVADTCAVPIVCTSDYVLPGFVNEKTLVIISSYSGDTEETVAAMDEAFSKGAEVACITSGGKIGKIAAEKGLNCILIPGGNPPRSMFGYSAIQQLYMLAHYGFIGMDFEMSITNAIANMNNNMADLRANSLDIAKKIVDRIPVLYSEALYEGVTIRWRQQINENAKMLCSHHVFPEMNHNELVGWTGGDNRVAVVILRNEDDHKRSQMRMEICKKLMGEKCDTILEARSKGANRIERSLYLVHLGDWISIDLAELRNEDATAIPAIIFLKGELAKMQ
jgi:glucose/mannose-6-phosphate isomerase